MGFSAKNTNHSRKTDQDLKLSVNRLETLLLELTKTQPTKGGLPRLFRFKTLSNRLDIPKSTLRLELESGRLQGFKFGSRWYVSEKAATAWLENIMTKGNFTH